MKALELLLYTYATQSHQKQIHPVTVWAYQVVMGVDDIRWSMLKRITEWRAKRRTVVELKALTNTLLCDIGIERSEIEKVVEERWDPAPGPAVANTTGLSTLRVGKLENLPTTASNDHSVDCAA